MIQWQYSTPATRSGKLPQCFAIPVPRVDGCVLAYAIMYLIFFSFWGMDHDPLRYSIVSLTACVRLTRLTAFPCLTSHGCFDLISRKVIKREV